jgi:hypothetical protein
MNGFSAKGICGLLALNMVNGLIRNAPTPDSTGTGTDTSTGTEDTKLADDVAESTGSKTSWKVKMAKGNCYRSAFATAAGAGSLIVRMVSYIAFIIDDAACAANTATCARLVLGIIEPMFTIPAMTLSTIGDCEKSTATQDDEDFKSLGQDDSVLKLIDRLVAEDTKIQGRQVVCASRVVRTFGGVFAGVAHDALQVKKACFTSGDMNKSYSFLVPKCGAVITQTSFAPLTPFLGVKNAFDSGKHCKKGASSVFDRNACALTCDKSIGILQSGLTLAAYILNSLSECSSSPTHDKGQICTSASLKLAAEVTALVKNGAYTAFFDCFSKTPAMLEGDNGGAVDR